MAEVGGLKVKLTLDTKVIEQALTDLRPHIEAFTAWYETLPEPVKAYLRFTAAIREIKEMTGTAPSREQLMAIREGLRRLDREQW